MKIMLALYYLFFKHLPSTIFPGGKLFLLLRIWCLRRIITIGKNCKVQKGVYIGKGKNIKIGNNCHINEYVRLNNVTIGNNVMIARESIILGAMHEYDDVNKPIIEQGVKETSHTIIEDDVWVGLRVIILPGLRVKKGCIIGAGAVLTKDTEENGIYGGVPAKRIKERK
jgi:maltose O-acetyltransferase